MPKHIQMGTEFMANTATATPTTNLSSSTSSSSASDHPRPDLLSAHGLPSYSSNSSSSSHNNRQAANAAASESSRLSTGSGSNAGSYQMAMENIIDDYR